MNIFIYISEIQTLLKTYIQKLGFILIKFASLVYTLGCNVSWIYKHRDWKET